MNTFAAQYLDNTAKYRLPVKYYHVIKHGTLGFRVQYYGY